MTQDIGPLGEGESERGSGIPIIRVTPFVPMKSLSNSPRRLTL